jgi:DNA-binding IclR family transcriptional regulator
MAVINLLTQRGDEGATLSEIADTLGQSRATFVHVLAALAGGGFVVRRPVDRRYHLGPALIAPGQAAAARFPALGETRIAIEDLSRSLGYAVFAFARDGDHARLVDAVWDLRRPSPALHIGDLLPIEPPLGSVFVAWAAPSRVEAWLGRVPDPASLLPSSLGEVLQGVRTRGYSVALDHEIRRGLGDALEHLADTPVDAGARGSVGAMVDALGRGEYQVSSLDPARAYDVSMIAAPVFGPDAQPVLALTLVGFAAGLTGAQVAGYGERVRDAGLVITKQSRGRAPD